MIQIQNTNKTWLIVLTIMLSITNSYAQNTSVKISGIRSIKGQLILNVFKNSEDYEKEKVFKKFIFDKKTIEKGLMDVNINIEPGIYGITLIDDENKSGDLNKNFIGMPKEGFGFSNFFMEKLKKPAFDDFKIILKNQSNKFNIKVKYM